MRGLTLSFCLLCSVAFADTPADSLLRDLGSRLRALPQSPAAPFNTPSPLPDVRPLVGVSSARITRALGAGIPCRDRAPMVCTNDGSYCAPRGHDWSPCTGPGRMFSFYRLPDGWLGGGPELILREENGRVIGARWVQTQ